MPSRRIKRWVRAAAVLAVVCGWSVCCRAGTRSDELPADLQLSQEEIDEARALSHFAWGLFLQMSSDEGFDVAADEYAEGLGLSPDSKVLLDHLVTPYLVQKRFDRVEERLQPLVEKYPEVPRLNLAYVEALRRQNRTDEAIRHLRASLEAGGWREPPLLRELFVMLWREKRYDETENLLRKARRKNGLQGHFVVEHASAIFYSALKLTDAAENDSRRNGELDRKALKHARRAVEQVAQAERALDVESLANLLIDHEEYSTVLTMLENVRKSTRVDDPDLLLLEAKALARLERNDDAAHILERLSAEPDLKPYVLPEMARMYSDMGRFEEAVTAYERALLAFPEALPVRLQMAYCHLRLEQPKKGLAVLLPVKKLPPGGFRLMAHLYRQMGQTDEALEALDKAERVARDARDSSFFSVDFHLFYATVCEDAGRHDQAIEQARKALALDPTDPVICNFLGYVLADHDQNLGEAATLILRALEKEPENDAYLDSLAWVRFRQGQFDDAHKAMNEALRHGAANVDPVILDHAGDICQALGLHIMAHWYWEEALRRGPPNRDDILRKLGRDETST